TASQLRTTLSFCIPRPTALFAKPQPSGKGASHRGHRGGPLTARENRLMEYMSEGLTYKAIADRTGVSESAVHHMVTRIFRKLEVTNKIDAVRKWKNNSRT